MSEKQENKKWLPRSRRIATEIYSKLQLHTVSFLRETGYKDMVEIINAHLTELDSDNEPQTKPERSGKLLWEEYTTIVAGQFASWFNNLTPSERDTFLNMYEEIRNENLG